MSIHKSKGLEAKVVILADLFSSKSGISISRRCVLAYPQIYSLGIRSHGRESDIEIRRMELFEFNQQIKKGRREQEITVRRSDQGKGQSDNRGST